MQLTVYISCLLIRFFRTKQARELVSAFRNCTHGCMLRCYVVPQQRPSHETESETIHSHVMCVCVIFAHRHINNNNFEGNIDAIKDLTNLEKLCVWWAKGIIEKQSLKLLLIYSISQKSAQLLVILFLNLLNDEKNLRYMESNRFTGDIGPVERLAKLKRLCVRRV